MNKEHVEYVLVALNVAISILGGVAWVLWYLKPAIKSVRKMIGKD